MIRINTGAPVPPGADAVVMVEETKLVEATEEGEEVKVEILTKVGSWQLRWCWYFCLHYAVLKKNTQRCDMSCIWW